MYVHISYKFSLIVLYSRKFQSGYGNCIKTDQHEVYKVLLTSAAASFFLMEEKQYSCNKYMRHKSSCFNSR